MQHMDAIWIMWFIFLDLFPVPNRTLIQNMGGLKGFRPWPQALYDRQAHYQPPWRHAT